MTATRTLGRPVRMLGETDSTMTQAADWAQGGAPHGALVVAEHQTAGRGRHGRDWISRTGESLLLTLVLRPDLPSNRLGLIPLAAGLAVAQAADAFGVRAEVKWPNDVRVAGRKLAGVLAEARDGGRVVLLGIGLNVAQRTFPPDLPATSLSLITGRPVDRLAPLDAVLDALDTRLGHIRDAPSRLVAEIETRLEGIGTDATIREPATGRVLTTGTVLGLAADGALRLRTADGDRTVHAGEVTLSP